MKIMMGLNGEGCLLETCCFLGRGGGGGGVLLWGLGKGEGERGKGKGREGEEWEGGMYFLE